MACERRKTSMHSFVRTYRALALALLLAMILIACVGQAGPTGGATGTIKVGSKDFTEEFIVAEIYAQLLENAGFTVERKLNLGGTPVAQAAIVKGDIELYPEYTSTGLQTILKDTNRY